MLGREPRVRIGEIQDLQPLALGSNGFCRGGEQGRHLIGGLRQVAQRQPFVEGIALVGLRPQDDRLAEVLEGAVGAGGSHVRRLDVVLIRSRNAAIGAYPQGQSGGDSGRSGVGGYSQGFPGPQETSPQMIIW